MILRVRFLLVLLASFLSWAPTESAEQLHSFVAKSLSIGPHVCTLTLETIGYVHSVRGVINNTSAGGQPVGFVTMLMPGQSFQLSLPHDASGHLHWLELFRDKEHTIVITGDDEVWQ